MPIREYAISHSRLRTLTRSIPRPTSSFTLGISFITDGKMNTCAVATLAKARAPVYVLGGNRDDRANLRAAFSPCGYLASDSGFIDYTVDAYPVRLIALDTLSPGSNKGDFCPERVRRLLDLIDAEITRPIAVFAHHPPFEVAVGPEPL